MIGVTGERLPIRFRTWRWVTWHRVRCDGQVTRSTEDRDVLDRAPLDTRERRQLDVIRRFGTVGALLLAVGSLGAGAAPVIQPGVAACRCSGCSAA